jgi:hypothetical protein
MGITSFQPILLVLWTKFRKYSILKKGGILMEDNDKIFPHQRGHRWLLIGGLTLAFMLALGVGVLLGTSTGTTQASALTAVSNSSSQSPAVTQGGANSSQSLTFTQGSANYAQPMAGGPGAGMPQGQCETLTVSSVSGNTIVAKSSNGSSVTIHTTANTSYRQAGKTVTASAITVGAKIHVMGTHNSDGSITATSIDIS